MKYTFFTFHDSILVDGLRAALIIDDDASSTSSLNSTLPATIISLSLIKTGTMKQFPKQKGAKKRTPNRLHFDESQNKVFENNQVYTDDDKTTCWYSGKELRKFKEANKILVDEILYAERSHKTTKRSLWGNHVYATSYSTVMQHTFQACCQCTHEIDDTTIRFLACADEKRLHQEMLKDDERNCSSIDDNTTRWGIERKILDTVIGDDYRFGRRKEMNKIVFSIQRLEASSIAMKKRSSTSDLVTEGIMSNNEVAEVSGSAQLRAEYIRKACQKHSRPSCLFARQMALSLAATINN